MFVFTFGDAIAIAVSAIVTVAILVGFVADWWKNRKG